MKSSAAATGFVLSLLLACSTLAAQEPAAPVTPASSYQRLTDPRVAETLKLSDDQRVQIANLITQRAEGLAKAGPDERAELLAQSEKSLEAVLTPEQRSQFLKEMAEPRLRFNFRFQRWSDVLEWLAKQSDLSLVLDAPPPGTFNYSDTKEYTATEALDLLNGVLTTKGYTLIRRGRMLMVIDIQDGVPDGLVPTIPLSELDTRGKFELVTVMFPVGDRDPQAVKTEITPLLGPFGKSVLLAQSRQIIVTDTAGIVRAISRVISSMPQPEPERRKDPPPSPVLEVYSVRAADGKIAEDVLTKMFPSAKIVADLKAEQINAFATPAEQSAIKAVLEQMQTHNPPDRRPTLEVYPVRDQDAAQLVPNLLLVAPTARISFDARERQILAFANPADQANLKAAIEKLAVSGPVDRSRQLEIYRLSTADPATTFTLLQGLLPQAKFTLDPLTRRIVAVASVDDHKAIKAVLDQIQSTAEGPDTVRLEFYPLDEPLSATAMSLLVSLAPKAKIVADTEAKRLQVLATAADQAVVKENLESILKGRPTVEKRKLAVFKVMPEQRARFQAILPTLSADFPDIRVVADGEPNELAIWAKPSQHELLQGLIDSLAREPVEGEETQLVAHPLRSADPATATTILKTLVPQAKVSLDAVNRQVVVIATVKDQNAIKETIEKLQPGDLGPDTPVLRYYPVDQPLNATTLAAFARLVPKATVTQDVDGKALQVVATTAEQELVKKYLDEAQKGMPVAEKRKLSIYKVVPAQRARFLTLLPSMALEFPDVRAVPDGEPNELAIWAKPSQHEVLKGLIESLAGDSGAGDEVQLVTHPLRSADPTTATAILKTLVPQAKISLDLVNRHLVAIATTEDQQQIKSTIQKLQPGDLGPDTPLLRFYPLEQTLPTSALAAFSRLVPKATVTQDLDAKALQVVGTSAEHELIKSHLDDVLKGMPVTEKRKLSVYPVTPAQRVRFLAVMPTLRGDLPDIRVVTDGEPNELAIWAKPSQHELLKGIFDELVRETPVTEKYQLVSYPLKAADPNTASTVLQTLFPGAKITVDLNGNRLLIWTRSADHVEVKKAIEELDSDEAGERRDKVVVYPVPEIDPDVAVGLLQSVLPKVRMMKDTKARTIVAWAKKADHETISRTLASMRTSADGDQKPRLKYFPPGKFNAASVIDVLRVAMPTVRIAVDPKTGGLVALGTVADHEQVESAISQITSQAGAQAAQLVTYHLPRAGASSAFQILSQAAPDARVALGQDSSHLLVWARPDDHLIVQKIVEQLEADSSAKKKFELRPYTLKATGAGTVIPLLSRAVPKATLNIGNTPNKLIVWAVPEDHAIVEQVVKQFDAVHAPDTTIEFYDIQNIDSDSALRLAQAMLQKDSVGTNVSVISGSNQLYVEARAEQHEMIRDGLKRLKTSSEAGFEVFQLETVDPSSAEVMIRRMFGGSRLSGPVVEPDFASQKLFVRGTKEQIKRIEELLEKMGEKGLSRQEPAGSPTMRVVPFGGDTSSALKEILRIWPKLRSNELRIIPGSDRGSNLLLPGSGLKKQPATSDKPVTNDVPLGTKPIPAESPKPKLLKEQIDGADDQDEEETLEDLGDDEGAEEETLKSGKSAARPITVPRQTTDVVSTQGTVAQVQAQSTEPPAPIVILPREGSVTIFSEDLEALEQFDKLLRVMSGPQQTTGRGFSVYGLKIAGATQVAETLRQALRSQSGGGFRSGGSGPTVVADERLNAIIVHGSRADRASIETLLEVLDSADMPDSRAANRPKRVSVKHGSAVQIEQVLRLVYKSQLSTGGGRKELPIPFGLAPEIAATLQQLNAMNSGPVLSLSVDEVTNSIVIMAPAAITEQVASLIHELDEASLTENSRGISIVPLERMNSSKTQKVLNLIQEKSRRRDRR
ncbi:MULTISPECIES: secretin N-terminal domain-containing protein [unclassified Schlesneria]|uniref:secretin N-terminal domain-containing protein n=1 Tax=Schlesneria TaxID=656899 RepID=UPI0035A021A7